MPEFPYPPLDAVQVSGIRITDPVQHVGSVVVGTGLQWSDGNDATYARIVTTGGTDGDGNNLLFPDNAYVTWPDLSATDTATLYDLQMRLRIKVENLGAGVHSGINVMSLASNPAEEGFWQLTGIPTVVVPEADFGAIADIVFSWREALLALGFYTEADIPLLWPYLLPAYIEQVRSFELTAEFVGDETDIFQATIYEASLVVVTTETVIDNELDLSRCAFT